MTVATLKRPDPIEFHPMIVQVQELLKAHGWSEPDHITGTVLKDYETEVGVRTASTLFRISSDLQCVVYGVYYSEGRNALATTFAWIPLDASPAAVVEHVDKFAKEADHVVDQSYARRLFLRGTPEPEAASESTPVDRPRG